MKKMKKFLIALTTLAVCMGIAFAADEEFGPVYLSYGEGGDWEGFDFIDCILADEAYSEELEDEYDTTLVVMKDGSSLHFFHGEQYDDDFFESIAEEGSKLYYTLYAQIDPETADPNTSVLQFRGNYYVDTKEYGEVTKKCSFTTDELFANGADLIYIGGHFDYYIMLASSVPEKPAFEKTWLLASADDDTGKIVLEWDAVDGAQEYEVYRCSQQDGIYTKLWTGSGTTWTDTSTVAGKLYYYRVRGIAGDQVGEFSRAASRWGKLPRPVVTGVYDAYADEIVLTWDAIDGASSYEVYLYSASDGYYKYLATTEESKFIHTSVEAGKTHRYKVSALHSSYSGNSSRSEEVSVTCGEHIHTEEIIPGKAATCIEDGLTDGKRCSVCGEVTVEQKGIPAPGHTEEVIPGKEATFTTPGLTDGKKCSVCGVILVEQEEIPTLEFITGTCGDNLTWVLSNDGVLTISGTGAMFDFKAAEDLQPQSVVPMSEAALEAAPWSVYSSLITQVIVESGVTSIGDNAFAACEKLTEVKIPGTVTEIGDDVFSGCEALETVTYTGSEEQWDKIKIGEGNEAVEEKVVISAVLMGDVTGDGVVDVGDAVMLLKAIASKTTDEFSSDVFTAADVTRDGTIDVGDAVKLLKAIASKTTDEL